MAPGKYQSNASIFPLELRQPAYAEASSSSRQGTDDAFDPIPFPEIEFQDCSGYVDFDWINAKTKSFQEGIATGIAQNGINKPHDSAVSNAALGKRKAMDGDSRSRDLKRRPIDDGERRTVRSLCRFAIIARDRSSAEHGRRLDGVADEFGSVPLLDDIHTNSMQLASKKSREADDLIRSRIHLLDDDERICISLPIVDTDRVDLAKSPFLFTNGAWLEAAIWMSKKASAKGVDRIISVDVSLRLVKRPKLFIFDSFAEAFVLELNLDVHFHLSAASVAAPLSSASDISLVHSIVRFAFCDEAKEKKIRSSDVLSASDIYSAMHSSALPPLTSLQPRELNATMFPFQRSSLHFLLGREGKIVEQKSEEEGFKIAQLQDGLMSYDGVQESGLWWEKLATDLFFNPLIGTFTSEVARTRINNVRGGILAEEMGLGKTVEVYALILLNAEEERSMLPVYRDDELEVDVSPTKTTLIVAPEVLRQQWLDEALLHAPNLRTFSYVGYKDAQKHIPSDKNWAEFARQFDVMVVSYDTLRKELNVARKAPSRSMRHERKYERPRSLLVSLNFHRVVMDEVQLVGHSSAAETVSMIPRNYSLAVSGTPIKQLPDLRSLLKFLGVPGPFHNESHWTRLKTPEMLPSVASLLSVLTTRHTKKQVESQMVLPEQMRVLVPVEFTAVESAFYRDINQQSRRTLGFNEFEELNRSSLLKALRERFDRDVSQLQGIVIALRQACTHPQIANRSLRGNVLAASQTIRSMDEVLTIMIEGTRSDHSSALHSLFQSRVDRAVLLLQDKENDDRQDIALAMLRAVQPEIERQCAIVKADLDRANRVGPLYRFDDAELEKLAVEHPGTDEVADAPFDQQPKSQAEREQQHDLAMKRALRARFITAVQARYRVFLEQLHRCHHFQGNIYFQLGEKLKPTETNTVGMDVESMAPLLSSSAIIEQPQDSEHQVGAETTSEIARLKEEENSAYKEAEDVRQKLLKFSRNAVDLELEHMRQAASKLDLNALKPSISFGTGGLRSHELFETLAILLERLEKQSDLLLDWRQQILDRLNKAVNRNVSEEDENDDQYQENLDAQAEAEALLEMYRVLIAEREYMLSGNKLAGTLGRPQLYSELVREVAHFERLYRRLKLWEMQGSEESQRPLAKDDYLPTEQELVVMKSQLEHFRKMEADKREVAVSGESKIQDTLRGRWSREDGGDIDAADDGRDQRSTQAKERNVDDPVPFETIRKDLQEISQKVDGREESLIARVGVEKIRRLASDQKPIVEALKRESTHFSQAWNARAAYFKQMQELSDQVGDISTANITQHIKELEAGEQVLKRRVDASEGRLRYLHAIEAEDEKSGDADTSPAGSNGVSKTCPICTEPVTKGVVLDVCGHITCSDCFRRWTAQRRQCPICKASVNPRNIYRVTYGKEAKKQRKIEIPESARRRHQLKRFNVMDQDLQHDISRVQIHSALGSKLDFLMRHLLYLERTEPGIKSLVFTSFSRGIALVGDALRLNGIKFVSLESGGARGGKAVDTFKNDAAVNVMLLHSEAQSSGLNLVCAQNIFLLEPLVNHSIELQAIGRVHRIGQTKPTTVFCYQVNNTVEERIVNLARTRGQSLYTHDKCVSNSLHDSAEMTAKTHEDRTRLAGRQGEFVANASDLVECLVDDDDDESDEAARGQKNGRHDANASSSRGAGHDGEFKEEHNAQEVERTRMREERLRAIETRRAMDSIHDEQLRMQR